MGHQIAEAKAFIDQLYELGFTPSQIESIIRNIAGKSRLEELTPAKLTLLLRELDNYIWFTRRCKSIG